MAGEPLGLSAVAWAEFLCGPIRANDRKLAEVVLTVIEPLAPADSVKGAELFNLSGRRSRSLADCLIAGTAIRCGVRIATANRSDFLPFVAHGLLFVGASPPP